VKLLLIPAKSVAWVGIFGHLRLGIFLYTQVRLFLASSLTAMNSEETIKDLCIRAIKAEGDDFPLAAEVLLAALRAHIESVRVMAAAALTTRGSGNRL
jgi:hypothetical protein